MFNQSEVEGLVLGQARRSACLIMAGRPDDRDGAAGDGAV
jgi:hypothetical protein